MKKVKHSVGMDFYHTLNVTVIFHYEVCQRTGCEGNDGIIQEGAKLITVDYMGERCCKWWRNDHIKYERPPRHVGKTQMHSTLKNGHQVAKR